MKDAVEVVALLRGEPAATHRLSSARRLRATLAAALPFAACAAAGCALVPLRLAPTTTIYLPGYLLACAALAVAALLLARRAWLRASRFTVGPELKAGAFARRPGDLVRLTRTGAEILVDGDVTGTLSAGDDDVALESLARDGAARIGLARTERAVIVSEPMTYAVRWVPDRSARARLPWRAMVRPALAGVVLGALPTMLTSHSVNASFALPSPRAALQIRRVNGYDVVLDAAESAVRQQAQAQADDLGLCFDSLPAACRKTASLSIGVALTTEGDVRRAWVQRSSLPETCDVDDCVRRIVTGWRFDEMKRPRTFMLPLRVAGSPLASLPPPWPEVASEASNGVTRVMMKDDPKQQ